MPSLFDIGKSGLQAYRQSLAVTGQNIANINTDGYKKREASLEEVTELVVVSQKYLIKLVWVSELKI